MTPAVDALRALHQPGRPLVLPNAYDASSAKVFAAAGFPAVATTSGGVAESLGYADHQQTPPDEMFASVARIVRAVDVPVTADVEAGYGLTPSVLVERLIAVGAAGMNLEDSSYDGEAGGVLIDAHLNAERLGLARTAARQLGVDLLINARVDVFLRARDDDPMRGVPEAVRRAKLYLEAGADCVYPIGLEDEAAIATIVSEVAAPVNVMWRRGAPSLVRLAELGVARVSFGGGFYRAVMAHLTAMAEAVRGGDVDALLRRP